MLGIPDPYTAIAKFAAIGVLALGLFVGGAKLGYNYSEGQNARAELLIEKVADRAQMGAAAAIAKINITQTTIQQKTQEILREIPVYRDCINDPGVERLLDDARANREPTVAPGGSELPGTPAH